jgi:drug/metabolite transporter (DMT)-like permease
MKNFKGYLAWISISVIWGTTFLAIRIGVKQLPPMLFAGFRWLIAGSFFLLFLRLRGYTLPSKKDLIKLSIVGASMLGLSNGLIVVAEQWIPSGLTSLLLATIPLWATFTESFLKNSHKNGLKTYLGLILGFTGVLIIFSGKLEFEIKGTYLLGIIFIFVSVFSWVFGTLYSKYKLSGIHPLMGASIQMLVAGTLQTVLGIVMGEFTKFIFNTESFLAFAYLVIIASILGFGSYMYALSKLPVSFVMTHAYINPIIALFIGWLILDELIGLNIILAAVIILLSVFIVKSGNKKELKR